MPSFDIVSKVNMAEVDNAFQQAKKEIDQRYDFKGTDTGVERVQTEKENGIRIKSSTEQRLEAAREIVVTKLAKRGISLRSVKYGTVEQSGKNQLQLITFQSGLAVEKAKAIVKLIKDFEAQGAGRDPGRQRARLGKNRDDLQSAMQLMRQKSEELDVDIGFENFRD